MPQDVCEVLFRLAKEAPGQTVTITLGGRPIHVVQSMDAARHVVVANIANYQKLMHLTRQVLGPSRLTEDGAEWRDMYRTTQPALSNFNVQMVREVAYKWISSLAEDIKRRSSAAPVPIEQSAFNQMAAEVMSETILQRPLSDIGPGCMEDVSIMLHYINLLTSFGEDATTAIDKQETLNLIRARRRWLQRMKDLKATVTPRDVLLHRMLEGGRSGAPAGDFDHAVLLLFAAGSDTTAGTVAWGLYVLAGNAKLQNHLRAALEPLWDGDELDLSQASTNETLMRFLAELLRLYPTVPLMTKIAQADDVVEGHIVKAGEAVMISNIGIGRNPAKFDQPEAFRLDRTDRAGCPQDDTMPFSAGPRQCGGMKLALQELPIYIAVLLRHLRFALQSNESPETCWQLTMHFANGVPVQASPVGRA
jgi:cytochrome P450